MRGALIRTDLPFYVPSCLLCHFIMGSGMDKQQLALRALFLLLLPRLMARSSGAPPSARSVLLKSGAGDARRLA